MPSFANIQEEIASMLSIPDEELTDEQRAAMDAYLDELGTQEADKVDSFAAFIRAETARNKYYREESQRFANKAKTSESRINFLKSRYLATMQQAGVKKITGNAYTLSIRSTPAVEVEDVDLLDDLYCRVIPERREPDKQIIKEYLRAGGSLPGCRLVQSDSLQIR